MVTAIHSELVDSHKIVLKGSRSARGRQRIDTLQSSSHQPENFLTGTVEQIEYIDKSPIAPETPLPLQGEDRRHSSYIIFWKALEVL